MKMKLSNGVFHHLFFQASLLAFFLTVAHAQSGPEQGFKAWDRNGDGVLVKEEVPEGPRRIFDRVDVNRDGKVTLKEHLAAMGGNANKRPAQGAPGRDNRPPRTVEAELPRWDHAEISRITINQKWEQEPQGFDREAFVSVPKNAKGKIPVLIYLHGAGGSAKRSLGGWRDFSDRILVVPQGYQLGWNVHGEATHAPDVEFIVRLAKKIGEHPNADKNNISVLGTSNGGGMVHKLLVELDEPLFRWYIPTVSSMMEVQFHDGEFWIPSGSTRLYDKRKQFTAGKRVAYFHGTKDSVIPYDGGLRFGQFKHVSAMETTYALAKGNGYKGPPLKDRDGKRVANGIVKFHYPGTNVTHYRVEEGNHGLGPHRKVAMDIVKKILAGED